MSLCPIRQFRISSALDDDRELSASLQRHVDACPRCRQFLDNSRSLGKSLAAPTPVETPPWLHTTIMAKVNGTFPDAMTWTGVALIIAGGIYMFWRETVVQGSAETTGVYKRR